MEHHANELEGRFRRAYLERLNVRVRKMRRLLAEREWELLRQECRHLKGTGDSFGFQILTELATRADAAIPSGSGARALPLPDARRAIETLIIAIDDVLTENPIYS